MSTKRYTPEFKDEAVRQVVDRGYSVAEVVGLLYGDAEVEHSCGDAMVEVTVS